MAVFLNLLKTLLSLTVKSISLAKKAAQKTIILLKDTQENLPISPETHRRIRLYCLEGGKEEL